MNVPPEVFYDEARIAIAPMGFCFPGQDAKGGDLPPRRECAPLWRTQLMAELVSVDLVLLVGGYAQRWHLGQEAAAGLTQTVRSGPRTFALTESRTALAVPLPHPSWRNTGWLKSNLWFDAVIVPALRGLIAERI